MSSSFFPTSILGSGSETGTIFRTAPASRSVRPIVKSSQSIQPELDQLRKFWDNLEISLMSLRSAIEEVRINRQRLLDFLDTPLENDFSSIDTPFANSPLETMRDSIGSYNTESKTWSFTIHLPLKTTESSKVILFPFGTSRIRGSLPSSVIFTDESREIEGNLLTVNEWIGYEKSPFSKIFMKLIHKINS